MNWEAIGAIGEIIGAAAVVVTLLVLVMQLRQNTSEMRANTVRSLQEKSIDLFGEGMLSTELPGIVAKNKKDETLTDEEFERYLMFVRRNVQLFEQVFIQHSEGRITDEVMAAYNRRIRAHFENKHWDEIWTFIKPLMTESFQRHVEALRGV